MPPRRTIRPTVPRTTRCSRCSRRPSGTTRAASTSGPSTAARSCGTRSTASPSRVNSCPKKPPPWRSGWSNNSPASTPPTAGKPQKGKMKIGTERTKHDIDVQTAGSTSGEQMKLSVDYKKSFEFRVADLGFLPEQEKDRHEHGRRARRRRPADGPRRPGPDEPRLRTPETATTRSCRTSRPSNATRRTNSTASPKTNWPGTPRRAKSSSRSIGSSAQQPDVILLDRCDDPRSAIDLAKYSQDGKRCYVAMRVGNTFDPINQWRRLIGDDTLAMNSLRLVIAGRLVRTLCEACKVPYTPRAGSAEKDEHVARQGRQAL